MLELSNRLKISSRTQKRIEKQTEAPARSSLLPLASLRKQVVKKPRTSSLLRADDKEIAVLAIARALLGKVHSQIYDN